MHSKLEPVVLKLGEVLCEPDADTTHVYFPNDSLISLLAVAGGKPLEVGMVGREGMTGFSLALGVRKSPARALVQGSGTAMRMSAASFRSEMKRNRWLLESVWRCAHASMATAMQVAACNNAHVLIQRFARWLLMTGDCVGVDTFFLTQEFLAQMLGVRRTGVTEAAGALQGRGLINYRRGAITILKRAELVTVACDCYARIRSLPR
jgi:CRP-like cAMP-binding protein